MKSPTLCAYAPPGEYIKDHTFLFRDGWWHLYSISGTRGFCHLANGNEETISWSISRDLVDWEFRGHVLHASLRKGEFDQSEVWAPFCLDANGQARMFYTGVRHPNRPLRCEKTTEPLPPTIWEGHRETIGVAVSDDLTAWEKTADRENGIGIPGRDPHVVSDPDNGRWLLYSTGPTKDGVCEEYVSQSRDLLNWEHLGVCARMPQDGYQYSTSESMFAMRHPLNGKWLLIGNWHYVVSDDPTDFTQSPARRHFDGCPEQSQWLSALGFAGEILHHGGKWYRSGVLGLADHWMLGFHEIEWNPDGAFRIATPSIATWQF